MDDGAFLVFAPIPNGGAVDRQFRVDTSARDSR
jgi:hypothetical protein